MRGQKLFFFQYLQINKHQIRQQQFFKDLNQLKKARAKMQIPSWKKLPNRISGPAKTVNDWLTQSLDIGFHIIYDKIFKG